MAKVTIEDVKLLDKYLTSKNIDYVLTGTVALTLHGALPAGYDADDIDIIVRTRPDNREIIMNMLAELETLSGCKYGAEHYNQRVYIFKIGKNNVKVNAFENNALLNNEPVRYQIQMIDGSLICVHDVMDIFRAKFGMGRLKDHHFCVKMFNQICAMFPCSKK